MKKAKWIEVTEFCNKYEINVGAVHTMRHYQRNLKAVKKIKNKTYLNENWFVKRHDLINSFSENMQKYYYEIIDAGLKNSDIYEALKLLKVGLSDVKKPAVVVYLNTSIFYLINRKIINTNVRIEKIKYLFGLKRVLKRVRILQSEGLEVTRANLLTLV